jgi:hypothetical protein
MQLKRKAAVNIQFGRTGHLETQDVGMICDEDGSRRDF